MQQKVSMELWGNRSWHVATQLLFAVVILFEGKPVDLDPSTVDFYVVGKINGNECLAKDQVD